jgi:hypothetical protein
MTREDIIRIYNQVSDELCGGKEWAWTGVEEPLQRFAALVAAAEREACAKVCETEGSVDDLPEHYADAIRSRGEVQP